MKKLLLLFALIALSCSSDDDSGSTDLITNLPGYQEPFFWPGTTKDKIVEEFGDDYDTEDNEFSLGYKMCYDDLTKPGVVEMCFSLDNDLGLYETIVTYYPTKENLELLIKEMEEKYGTPNKTDAKGLVVYRYPDTDMFSVELMHLSGDYTGIVSVKEAF
ncbi:hypothetical protein SAMN02927921_00005 [Sinomicrobium oceani]|uniref:Lipoprotein n=1 Tax=Sinomicrobium oceani TaxID=1150368 RepID=A0A1K1LKB2_9FLAO|nr:hypothetical protein [Sinomicrobium oceani]SFW11320.1 hypothetical protein SAMN02927921_00005 [Sinomicrobium oceani]